MPMTIESDRDEDYHTNMEARIARLEVAVEYLSRDVRDVKEELRAVKDELRAVRRDMVNDFRLQFGALITVALGMAALMSKGFGWL